MVDKHQIVPFFNDWGENRVYSCLQGHMDYMIDNNEANSSVAQIVIGDFWFFAGTPNQALIFSKTPIIVPRYEHFIKK